mgnify:CR=1 FL=1
MEQKAVAQPPRMIGLCLDPLGVDVGTASNATAEIEVTRKAIPPAALLPFHAGEPLRADLDGTPHIRGSGFGSSEEAAVSARNGCGRWPLAYAWPALLDVRCWSWQRANESRTYEPADAIATVAAAATAEATGSRSARPQVALTIPNILNEAKQQELLDAAGRVGLDLQLLWRPVAAAMAWLKHANHQLTEQVTQDQQELGPLLCLYLGVDSVEAVVVELVGRRNGNQRCVVPGRRRPHQDELLPAALLPLVEHAVHAATGNLQQEELNDRWRWTWASGLLPRLISALSQSEDHASEALQKVRQDWAAACRNLTTSFHAVAAMPSFSDGRTRFNEPPSSLANWLAARPTLRHLTQKLLGAVVTGPLAATIARSGPLGQEVLDTAGLNAETVLVEGVDFPSAALANQSIQYLQRLASDRPTYLDTLPRIHIASIRRGEPTWIPLLQKTEQWVEGGKPWQRDPDLTGFSVSPRTTIDSDKPHLKMPLHHEDHETVRELDVLVEHELQQPEPVKLRVTVTPAQGNARVQVIPEVEQALGRRPIFVDWSKMKETDLTPEKYIDLMPRTFPDLMPRYSSTQCWHNVKSQLEQLVDRGGPTPRTDIAVLRKISEVLNRIDQNFPQDPKTGSRYATALSSKGHPPSQLGGEKLQTLVDRLVGQLPAAARPLSDRDKIVVRLLGYTSTPDSRFAKFLTDALKGRGRQVDAEVPIACGWCLRDSDHIRVFAELATRSNGDTDMHPNLNWIRPLGQVLRFRENATRSLTSDLAEQLARILGLRFQAVRKEGKGAHIFKNSAIAIVFLLRHRQYDDDFMPPDSDLAVWLKKEFATAYFCSNGYDGCSATAKEMIRLFPEIERACRKKRKTLKIQGGAIDVQAALYQLIQYINRAGEGYIRFSESGD